MKAKYYRFIYRSLEGGMWCSGSMAEAKAEAENSKKDQLFHFLYLCGGSGKSCQSVEGKNGHFHLLMMADFRLQTVRQVLQTLKEYSVDEVMMPQMEKETLEIMAQEYERDQDAAEQEIQFLENPATYLRDCKVAQVNEVKERETFRKGNRIFEVFCMGEGRERTLTLFHGSVDTDPQKEECVMNVKPMTAFRPCSPFVNPQNLNCEMQCMLYNDFTQCKRHNQKSGTYFVDGHLLFGSCKDADHFGDIRKALEKEWEKIRFVCLPEDGWNEQLLEIGTEETARYFIGTDKVKDTVIKAILRENPYHSFVLLGEKTGLCASGYYTDRL